MSIVRYGQLANGTYGMMDDLALSYNGNQAVYVKESSQTVNPEGSNDFRLGSAASTHYFYDKNGRLVKDLNKNITDISYNSLHLPGSITVNGATHTYVYAADGRKLRVVEGGVTRDYVGNLIYENGSLKRILFDGGYIEGGVYHFYLTDYLGNVSTVADATGNLVQQNRYYPFGLPTAETGNSEQDKQPYKYNGKELDRTNGLNWYDYGARMYDPALCRFLTMDPLAEKYYGISPYAYCLNNPVRFVDPDGMQVWMLFYSGADERFKAAAETRKKEIESMESFNAQNDYVYIQELGNLGNLEERVNSIISDASENGYGKTAEVAFWSHAGPDGPIGDSKTSGEYNLMNYTGLAMDQNQLSPEGWSRINWNFDSSESLISFYGCQSAGFAERFFGLSEDVTHTAGQSARVGPSSSTGNFKAISPWAGIFGTSKPVYYGSSENGLFFGVTLYTRGQSDGRILRKNASLETK